MPNDAYEQAIAEYLYPFRQTRYRMERLAIEDHFMHGWNAAIERIATLPTPDYAVDIRALIRAEKV